MALAAGWLLLTAVLTALLVLVCGVQRLLRGPASAPRSAAPAPASAAGPVRSAA